MLGERYAKKREFFKNLAIENQKAQYGEEYGVCPQIRVLITDSDDDSYDLEEVRIYSQAALNLTGAIEASVPANVIFDVSEVLSSGESIRIKSSQDGIGMTVESLEKNKDAPTYEGVLEIWRKDDTYYLVNEVDLETYIKYVVPSEMPYTYPVEALKAQAVCARTYALRQKMDKKLEAYGADVDDTIRFQVYAHASPQPSTTEAVEATKGQIITYEGEPIEAYFFSTSCGFTSGIEIWNSKKEAPYLRAISVSGLDNDATEVFSNSNGILSNEAFVEYLKSTNPNDLECSESWYRWKITFSWETIKNRVYAQYPEVGQLQRVEIVERSTGGAVICLKLQGTAGDAFIEGEYDVREFFAPKSQKVTLQDGTEASSPKTLPSAYFYVSYAYDEGEISGLRIYGGGYGHGLGLSQNGAKYMAEDGFSWKKIIQRFYQNVSIADIGY